MKTIDDLKALLPELKKMVLKNPEIGSTFYGRCEDDYDEEWADNYVSYEEDGWCIEISFKCIGDWSGDSGDYWTPPSYDLRRAWGEVTELSAYHCDENTDEETEFSEDELSGIWNELDKVLESI